MKQESFERMRTINADTVKAEEIMSPEQKEASKEREISAISDEVERRVEENSEKYREAISKHLRMILKENAFNEDVVRRVLHEYKKVRVGSMMESILRDSNDLKGGTERAMTYYSSEAHRGRGVLDAFGVEGSYDFGTEVQEIRNSTDPERYDRLVATNRSLIEGIGAKDSEKIKDSIRQIATLDLELAGKYEDRMPIITTLLEKWINGEMYNAQEGRKVPLEFNEATDDEKSRFITRIAGRDCWNFSTDSRDSTGPYCFGCGRIPKDFGMTYEEYKGIPAKTSSSGE